jgi:hypothetical protein
VEVEARLEQAQALIGQLAHRLHGPNIENILMYNLISIILSCNVEMWTGMQVILAIPGRKRRA